jgi:hypothetical protein
VTLVTRGVVQTLSVNDLQVVAAMLGLTIPDEDIEALAAMVGDQLAVIDRLEQPDLTDINPLLEFDPRWRD